MFFQLCRIIFHELKGKNKHFFQMWDIKIRTVFMSVPHPPFLSVRSGSVFFGGGGCDSSTRIISDQASNPALDLVNLNPDPKFSECKLELPPNNFHSA